MGVGDLVMRSWPPDSDRVGVIVAPTTSPYTDEDASDYFVVHWTDGIRDSIRAMFLKVVK